MRHGDCLWLLAGHRLGSNATGTQIAAYWPKLYSANRHVVGADPALITPGQVLVEPTRAARDDRGAGDQPAAQHGARRRSSRRLRRPERRHRSPSGRLPAASRPSTTSYPARR